jgi:hypothetical protein
MWLSPAPATSSSSPVVFTAAARPPRRPLPGPFIQTPGSSPRTFEIGLVQEPGWFFAKLRLAYKSRRFGVFFSKIRQIYYFLTEVVQ